jgi:hypothetical protein
MQHLKEEQRMEHLTDRQLTAHANLAAVLQRYIEDQEVG